MAKTKIEWTEESWNPVGGCTRVSPGCEHCYAEVMAGRFSDPGQWGHGLAERKQKPDGSTVYRWTGKLVERPEKVMTMPLRWRRPREVFVNSTSDLFHESIDDDTIHKVFAIMALTPQHRYQVLTKRSERMRRYFQSDPAELWAEHAAIYMHYDDMPERHDWPMSNISLGVSVESPDYLGRVDDLLHVPAATRFVSAEPLLAQTSFAEYLSEKVVHIPVWESPSVDLRAELGLDEPIPYKYLRPALDGIIVGGESGPGARPMHPDWVRLVRDECFAAGKDFFFKQWGSWVPVYDREIDDPDWRRCDRVARATPNGEWWNLAGGTGFHGERVVRMNRVSKKASGRLLDGHLFDALPWRKAA